MFEIALSYSIAQQAPIDSVNAPVTASQNRKTHHDTVISVLDDPDFYNRNDTIKRLTDEEMYELFKKYLSEEELKEIYGK